MKLKVNNAGVCHEFTSYEFCTDVRSGSMSLGFNYTNDSRKLLGIYSYSTFIGLRDLKENVYLLSSRSYSNTTAKHQSLLRQATYNYITVYDVNDTNEDNLEHMIDSLKNYANKQLKVRKTDYTSSINDTIDNMQKFLEYIKIDKRSALYKNCIAIINIYKGYQIEDIINHLLKLDEAQIKANKLKAKRDLKAKIKANQNLINSITHEVLSENLKNRKECFKRDDGIILIDGVRHTQYGLNDEFHRLSNIINRFELKEFYYFSNHKDLLKVTDKCNIITSQRVTISKKDSLLLYRGVMQKTIKKGDRVLDWTCNEVTADYIAVGCHTIAISDIKEVYQTLTQCKEV